MHACGHDAHTAILMAVAEVLTGIKDQLPGSVKFIFQPAEEGCDVQAEDCVWPGVLQRAVLDHRFGTPTPSSEGRVKAWTL